MKNMWKAFAAMTCLSMVIYSDTRLDTIITALTATYGKISSYSADVHSYTYTCG